MNILKLNMMGKLDANLNVGVTREEKQMFCQKKQTKQTNNKTKKTKKKLHYQLHYLSISCVISIKMYVIPLHDNIFYRKHMTMTNLIYIDRYYILQDKKYKKKGVLILKLQPAWIRYDYHNTFCEVPCVRVCVCVCLGNHVCTLP